MQNNERDAPASPHDDPPQLDPAGQPPAAGPDTAHPGGATAVPAPPPNGPRVEPTPDAAGAPADTAAIATPGPGHHPGPLRVLALAALGIVFGDIGTSPLYSLQTVFSIDHNAVAPTQLDVYGIIALVFWSITIVVSLKYVLLVMRADNEGEGGILALTALLRRTMKGARATWVITLLGIIGAGLFYGDSVITPAISVMSAVEGIEVVDPRAAHLVLPVSVVILTALFAIQRFGTALVGRAFGPVMLLWFLTLAALGIPQIVQHPGVLKGLSPTYAVEFALERPFIAFIAMGAVVLTITGAEALYADMGHFGARPIRLAWFALVFPCLTLNYLGQGALILNDPSAVDSPFFHLAPEPLVLPVVVLATLATVIASQSVISGAFSVSQQALNLGLLPRFAVRHTSKHEGGQIYVPVINTVLYVGVLVLILGFQSSAALANAYGLAVTGTLILTTVLFGGLAHRVWHWPMWLLVVLMVCVGGLEALYFGANLTKIVTGGWLPIVIATAVIVVMTTWMWGARLVRARREEIEVPLEQWLDKADDRGVVRVPGQSIYLHTDPTTVPLALKETLRFYHVLHENIAIITVHVRNIPHVRHVDRVHVDALGRDDGIVAIRIELGFNDTQDIPHNLKWSHGLCEEFEYDAAQARYFLSVLDIKVGPCSGLERWRKRLFVVLSRNAGSRVEAFGLPPQRTAILGGSLKI